jgi:hypothetical protein
VARADRFSANLEPVLGDGIVQLTWQDEVRENHLQVPGWQHPPPEPARTHWARAKTL